MNGPLPCSSNFKISASTSQSHACIDFVPWQQFRPCRHCRALTLDRRIIFVLVTSDEIVDYISSTCSARILKFWKYSHDKIPPSSNITYVCTIFSSNLSEFGQIKGVNNQNFLSSVLGCPLQSSCQCLWRRSSSCVGFLRPQKAGIITAATTTSGLASPSHKQGMQIFRQESSFSLSLSLVSTGPINFLLFFPSDVFYYP